MSKIPQTTRNQIRGIYNCDQGQAIFIDTPGLVRGKDQLDQFMKQCSFNATEEVDCVIHLVDANRSFGEEEEMITDRLVELSVPLVLGLNKVDLKGKNIPEHVSSYQERLGDKFNDLDKFIMLPLSGEKEMNMDKLIDIIFERLPAGEALYPEDIVSDTPQRVVIADIIREKYLGSLRQELPYSLAVDIEKIERRKNKLTYISARIFVQHESQKEIAIGKKGQVLKRVGSLARKELEELLERRVFLDLHVAVQKKWRDSFSILKDLGYVS